MKRQRVPGKHASVKCCSSYPHALIYFGISSPSNRRTIFSDGSRICVLVGIKGKNKQEIKSTRNVNIMV